jgi:O-ureido-D-serine cyclo-ligase
VTVGLVTASSAAHLDEDMAPLLAALEAIDVPTGVVIWDDPSVEWRHFELVVVRSTWDYVARRDELLAWADRVATVTSLANSSAVVRWSTDKHYIGELAAAGVPVTPTRFLEPGDAPGAKRDAIESGFEAAASQDIDGVRADGAIVVKPTVSAGSADTNRYGVHERVAAGEHVRRLLADGRSVMVQPYLSAVDQHGETAVVHFGGRFSHAVRKGPILTAGVQFVDGLFAAEHITRREPSDAELAVAERALAVVPGGAGRLLYARVDLIPGPDGQPLVLEVELAEPSVFLTAAPGAADRFAQAIAARIGR